MDLLFQLRNTEFTKFFEPWNAYNIIINNISVNVVLFFILIILLRCMVVMEVVVGGGGFESAVEVKVFLLANLSSG